MSDGLCGSFWKHPVNYICNVIQILFINLRIRLSLLYCFNHLDKHGSLD